MFDRLDRYILLPAVLISLIGISMIFSATNNVDHRSSLYLMQLAWFGVGLVALYFSAAAPPRLLHGITIPLYVLIVLLLVAVLAFGAVKGSTRWIRFGPVGIQPSEFAKIIVILVLAQFLERNRRNLHKPSVLITCLLIVGLPAALVLKQPDLGTTLVFGAILLGMLFWAGFNPLELLFIVSPVIGILICIISGFNWVVWSVFIFVLFGLIYLTSPPRWIAMTLFVIHLAVGVGAEPLWHSLHEYQRQRVVTFLDPQADALGAGYQIIQSQIAIGSGGLWGQGFRQGSQTQLSFLPEQHTDFIFSVVGEELGFAGTLIILGLFYLLVSRAIRVAGGVKSRYNCLVAGGCASALLFHVVMNIGMTLGLLPVAGVPLPFMSYGGSFLLTSMILCGLLINMWRRRFEY